ncbi:hypothetical protein N0V94_006683 [Neodidymelliopsis sp. IMI 364377]|nr:hypothetical protein N0V94_006683 [Neodidymelliopsis sp. IMI 364377]
MERLNSVATHGGERNDAVDHCLAGIDRLSHEVKDASSYIPAYDQRTYSEAIKALSEKLQTIRQTFNPPKKFAFKTRKNASAISISDAAELAASQRLRAPVISSDTSNTNSSFAPTPLDRLSPGERREQEVALGLQNGATSAPDTTTTTTASNDGISNTGPGTRRPSFSGSTSITITNHESLTIIPSASASHATTSGTLSNLTCCVIDLSSPTAVSPFSALYLKNIASSTITTGQVAGATHITDIAEEMKGMKNQWDQIDDFKWLKAEQSPNWRILPEAEREVPAPST